MIFIKKISDLICEPLSALLNESAKLGVFPRSLKEARVTPLFKGGDNVPKSYRPISNLSKIAKIFEKIIANRLMSFFSKYDIISKFQFAYRPNHSTTDILHAILDYIYKGLNHNETIIAVFLDLSQAFSTLPIDILLTKLNNYGIRGKMLDWFESYLTNRYQYVQINSERSDMKQVSIGVPQGSTLGPLLFMVYINDFFTCSELISYSYADDKTLLHKDKNADNLFSYVNRNLKRIYTWLCVNKLKLNVNKSKLMVFTNKKNFVYSNVNIGDQQVGITNQIKLLGLEIDEKLTFKNHIKKTCSKLSYVSHILTRFYTLPQAVRKKVYYAYAHPIMNYGISLWGSSYITHIRPLIRVQNSLVKKISYNYNKNISDIYKKEKILNIDSLKKYALLCNMHKIISNHAPLLLQELIHDSFFSSTKYTRNRDLIRKPAVKLTIMKRSFCWAAPTIFNSIPDYIKKNNYKNFKSRIFDYLVEHQEF